MRLNDFWSKVKAEQYIDTNEELKNTNMDLHMHTTALDGLDTPLKLLVRAYNRGINTISITDHNRVKGYRILEENIKEMISKIEEKDGKINGAEKLLEILSQMYIIPGCELVTTYKGCPYVEILGYGVDINILENEITRINIGLENPGNVICEGARRIKEENNLNIDMFPIENRSNYKKLFFHELIKHPENEHLYKDIEGETEEEKAENFAKRYIENPESDFYVDLNNQSTRKTDMQEMIEKHQELVFDIETIKQAGAAGGQFYNELLKDQRSKDLLGENIKNQKQFNYMGLYNEKSPFFIDLTSAKPKIEDVIEAIKNAGGVAIVAHWGRYYRSNPEIFDWKTKEGIENLYEIIQMCDGAECNYPDNPPELQEIIYNYCKENGKYISQGSDHHSIDGKEGKQYKIGTASGLEIGENAFARELRMPVKNLIQQCLLDRLEELSNEKKLKQEELKGLNKELLERNNPNKNGEKEYVE